MVEIFTREQLKLLQLKAESFDRIIEKYRTLEAGAQFYSRNWVELAEVIEAQLKRLGRPQAEGGAEH